jgi:hypothetical protein
MQTQTSGDPDNPYAPPAQKSQPGTAATPCDDVSCRSGTASTPVAPTIAAPESTTPACPDGQSLVYTQSTTGDGLFGARGSGIEQAPASGPSFLHCDTASPCPAGQVRYQVDGSQNSSCVATPPSCAPGTYPQLWVPGSDSPFGAGGFGPFGPGGGFSPGGGFGPGGLGLPGLLGGLAGGMDPSTSTGSGSTVAPPSGATWRCTSCDVIVHFGGLFGNLEVCAPKPPQNCGGDLVPTFKVDTGMWECDPDCDGSTYDPAEWMGLDICVPC